VANQKTIAEMPVGSVGRTHRYVLRVDRDGRDALRAGFPVAHLPSQRSTVRVERRADGYYVDYAEARPLGPARWNAKLIPVTGGLIAPARVRAALTALLAVADSSLEPDDPAFYALVCQAGADENVTAAEVQAILNMRLGDVQRLAHSPEAL
jgi:hypothetical protein